MKIHKGLLFGLLLWAVTSVAVVAWGIATKLMERV